LTMVCTDMIPIHQKKQLMIYEILYYPDYSE
jgi:hypothetical protein